MIHSQSCICCVGFTLSEPTTVFVNCFALHSQTQAASHFGKSLFAAKDKGDRLSGTAEGSIVGLSKLELRVIQCHYREKAGWRAEAPLKMSICVS